MKKLIFCIFIFLVVLLGGSYISYHTAKKKADTVALKYKDQISPLKGNLVIFVGSEFKPCWVFRAEHRYLLTGGTFDVYVSLFGNVIDTP